MQSTRSLEAQMKMAAWVARNVGRPLDAPLERDELDQLARVLQRRRAKAGATLFYEGKRAAGVCIVESGMVELLVGPSGSRNIVGLLHPGEVEGDLQTLLSQPFPYSGRAAEDVICLLIDAGDFRHLLAENRSLAMRWITSLGVRLARAQNRIITLLGQSVEQQTCRVLLDEAVSGTVRLPQVTIAAMIGATRSSLNKSLRGLEEQGVISLGYRDIEIRDPSELTRLAML